MAKHTKTRKRRGRHIEPNRARMGAFVVGALTLILLSLFSAPAFGSHISLTGPVPPHCVEIQQEDFTSYSPDDYPLVTITVTDWDSPNKMTVDFTIGGLSGGATMDVAIKTGPLSAEFTGFGNGAGQVASQSQHQVNHIRACVEAATTTTTAPSTTLAPPTTQATTTTQAATTTTLAPVAIETTTTTQPATTTTLAAIVQAPTTTQATTTTSSPGADETSTTAAASASTLPFTGVESGSMASVALSLMGIGSLGVVLGRTPVRKNES